MKFLSLCTVAVVCCSGCAAWALKQNTVDQVMTLPDLRTQEVLNNLAVLAHNPGTLPSFQLVTQGSSIEAMTVGPLDSRTSFDVNGFASQALSISGKHAPTMSWNLDPATNQPVLDALRCACLWVLNDGPPADGGHAIDVLRASTIDDVYPVLHCKPTLDPVSKKTYEVVDFKSVRNPEPPRPHFGVMDRLGSLTPKWLGHGTHADVPKCACYKAHCCDSYVWVTPAGLEALSEFTLIVMDIMDTDLATITPKMATANVDIQLCACDCKVSPSPGRDKKPNPGADTSSGTTSGNSDGATNAASGSGSATVTKTCPVYRVIGCDPSGLCERYYAVVQYDDNPPCCPYGTVTASFAPATEAAKKPFCFVPIPNPNCLCKVETPKMFAAPGVGPSVPNTLPVLPQIPGYLPGRRENQRY